MKTKAAVMYEAKAPLVVEEIELEPPQAGEVLVKVAATAICRSDLHALNLDWPIALPIVLGHEGAGVVEQVGEGVTRLAPGDLLAPAVTAPYRYARLPGFTPHWRT